MHLHTYILKWNGQGDRSKVGRNHCDLGANDVSGYMAEYTVGYIDPCA
jgi:hypothetical protein